MASKDNGKSLPLTIGFGSFGFGFFGFRVGCTAAHAMMYSLRNALKRWNHCPDHGPCGMRSLTNGYAQPHNSSHAHAHNSTTHAAAGPTAQPAKSACAAAACGRPRPCRAAGTGVAAAGLGLGGLRAFSSFFSQQQTQQQMQQPMPPHTHVTADAQSTASQQSSSSRSAGRSSSRSSHGHGYTHAHGSAPRSRTVRQSLAAAAGPVAMDTDSVGSSSSSRSGLPHSPSASSTDSSSSSPRLRAAQASASPTNAGAAMIPHPAKAAKGGEDAVFVSSTGRMPMVLAVADGVGGWADLGVDPGLFSRALLAGVEYRLNAMFQPNSANAAVAVAAADAAATEAVVVSAEQLAALPLDLIQFGYDHVRATKLHGSCTACVVAVHNGQLTARNLGDSGFLVLRPSQAVDMAGAEPLRVILRSEEHHHAFNFPKQLGCAEGKAEETAEADAYSLSVAPGDVVVLGTDGLFDNLSDAAIVAQVTRYLASLPAAAAGGSASAVTPAADTKEIAKLLALEAHRVAGSKERTPFADSARRHGHHYVGGKMDDISVIVGVV